MQRSDLTHKRQLAQSKPNRPIVFRINPPGIAQPSSPALDGHQVRRDAWQRALRSFHRSANFLMFRRVPVLTRRPTGLT
jgi:hypothetical protein